MINSGDLNKRCWSLDDKHPYLNRGDNDVKSGAIVKDINSRRCEESARERRTRDGEGMGQAGRPRPIGPTGLDLF